MKQFVFDTMADGHAVTAYEFGNTELMLTVLDYGGILQKVLFRGTDLIGGYDKIEGYLTQSGYQGALIGRYANRIRGGAFTLNGKKYQLCQNEEPRGNHLHGGSIGYDKRFWDAKPVVLPDGEALELTLVSPDGEENYPGTVQVKVTYTVRGTDFAIRYEAVSDKDTPFNMTNHGYFNMNGIAGGAIYDQTLQVFSDTMSEVDEALIPVGQRDVTGTAFDFRTPKLLSRELMDCDDPQMVFGAGLDHNLYITGTEKELWECRALTKAAVFSGKVGTMTLYTDMPCVQFYAGNFMAGDYPFKGGVKREKQHALCLETQFAPDGPNRGEAILRAGETYDYTARFSLK